MQRIIIILLVFLFLVVNAKIDCQIYSPDNRKNTTCYCKEYESCSNQVFECGSESCILFCMGDYSCFNLTVYFQNGLGFQTECIGSHACIGLRIYGPPEP